MYFPSMWFRILVLPDWPGASFCLGEKEYSPSDIKMRFLNSFISLLKLRLARLPELLHSIRKRHDPAWPLVLLCYDNGDIKDQRIMEGRKGRE